MIYGTATGRIKADTRSLDRGPHVICSMPKGADIKTEVRVNLHPRYPTTSEQPETARSRFSLNPQL